jgi:hypothetical protein
MVRSRLLTYVPVLMISGLVLLAGALVAAVALQADGGVPIPRSAADLDAPACQKTHRVDHEGHTRCGHE